jgi:hypothetical protein
MPVNIPAPAKPIPPRDRDPREENLAAALLAQLAKSEDEAVARWASRMLERGEAAAKELPVGGEVGT